MNWKELLSRIGFGRRKILDTGQAVAFSEVLSLRKHLSIYLPPDELPAWKTLPLIGSFAGKFEAVTILTEAPEWLALFDLAKNIRVTRAPGADALPKAGVVLNLDPHRDLPANKIGAGSVVLQVNGPSNLLLDPAPGNAIDLLTRFAGVIGCAGDAAPPQLLRNHLKGCDWPVPEVKNNQAGIIIHCTGKPKNLPEVAKYLQQNFGAHVTIIGKVKMSDTPHTLIQEEAGLVQLLNCCNEANLIVTNDDLVCEVLSVYFENVMNYIDITDRLIDHPTLQPPARDLIFLKMTHQGKGKR